MTHLALYLLVFFGLGVFFLFFHLMLGKLVRPARPDEEKLTIYECGEPTIGSAWVQFDLRYYVVALLFVIFDVEVAFFFPWAVVFGDANKLASDAYPHRTEATYRLIPVEGDQDNRPVRTPLITPVDGSGSNVNDIGPETAHRWAVVAFFDILVFFGVLMVGFAYLWRRGDINWVRGTAAPAPGPPAMAAAGLPARPPEELADAR